MKKFQSCARWEEKHGFHENITKDQHDTQDGAESVCRLLSRDGLGREGIHFPVETWVEEYQEIPMPHGFGLGWARVKTILESQDKCQTD